MALLPYDLIVCVLSYVITTPPVQHAHPTPDQRTPSTNDWLLTEGGKDKDFPSRPISLAEFDALCPGDYIDLISYTDDAGEVGDSASQHFSSGYQSAGSRTSPVDDLTSETNTDSLKYRSLRKGTEHECETNPPGSSVGEGTSPWPSELSPEQPPAS